MGAWIKRVNVPRTTGSRFPSVREETWKGRHLERTPRRGTGLERGHGFVMCGWRGGLSVLTRAPVYLPAHHLCPLRQRAGRGSDTSTRNAPSAPILVCKSCPPPFRSRAGVKPGQEACQRSLERLVPESKEIPKEEHPAEGQLKGAPACQPRDDSSFKIMTVAL